MERQVAIPRARVDIGPALDKDAGGVVVLVLQGVEERGVFVVVLDVDVVAALQQHLNTLRVTSRGCEVEWRGAEFAACDNNGGSGGDDGGDGSATGEFMRVSVEEEHARTGKRVDGYVALGEIT